MTGQRLLGLTILLPMAIRAGLGALALLGCAAAHAADPVQAPDLNQYGRAYLAEGDNKAAVQSYGDLVRLNPFDPVALNNMAVAKAAAGDYQAAAELLARAVRLAPNRADIRENLGNLQSWQDNYSNVALAATHPRPALQHAPALLPEPPQLWPEVRRSGATAATVTGTGTAQDAADAADSAAAAGTAGTGSDKKKRRRVPHRH
jgi:tetratricopeptide (TPR) repeat protein